MSAMPIPLYYTSTISLLYLYYTSTMEVLYVYYTSGYYVSAPQHTPVKIPPSLLLY